MLAWLTALIQMLGKALGMIQEYDPPETPEQKLEKDEQSNAGEAQKIEDGRP